MIDLETLGTDTDCPVISIGAVFFDEKGLGEEFEVNLDIDQQIANGRKPTGATIKWWMEQEEAAKKVFKEDYTTVESALRIFRYFCLKNDDIDLIRPWGNGSTFDISIIENLLTQYEFSIPWTFRNIRDLRTFKKEVYDGSDLKFDGVKHNALADAIFQAKVVIEGRERVKI